LQLKHYISNMFRFCIERRQGGHALISKCKYGVR
jgi:hypothetical protein